MVYDLRRKLESDRSHPEGLLDAATVGYRLRSREPCGE